MAALALASPGVAFASPPDEAVHPHASPAKRPRRAQVLLDMDDAMRPEREPTSVFRIRKRVGLEYARRFDRGAGRPIVLSIQGPALPRKRFGLWFEVRF